MIAYDLSCSNGHCFEGWFEDRKAFDLQKKKDLITCPVCDNTRIDIIPSTFGIKTSIPVEKPRGTSSPQEHAPPQQVINFLEKNFEDVGTDFAKEALKMHYEVTDKRNIRGISTNAEEKMLEKEGITFFKLPVPRMNS